MTGGRMLVPPLDAEPWPTLGPEVCDFIEDELVHGPGDILGQPIELTDEIRLFLYRLYEVFPCDHELAGRRRFKRAVLSRRKGVGKTEIAAWVAIAEMDPAAPVRCDGWRRLDGEWVPVGRPVVDPYIPMVAVTEEQTEDLAYGAVRAILQRCDLGDGYEIGLERVAHKTAPGTIQPRASAPSARDGARTTFQHFDETHLFTEPRLRRAHATMLRNIPKRYAADAFSLETTTMYAPGEDSVAEGAHRYAEQIAGGNVADSRLLVDHRQASEDHDFDTDEGLRAGLREASGDAWAFTDVESILALWHDPATDENEFRRYWANQPRRRARRWAPANLWQGLADPQRVLPDGARVVLAFDGSYSRDSTALVGCTVEQRPHVFVVKVWERPLGPAAAGWRTPRNDVDATVAAAMERWQVAELAADPPGWHREIEDWEATYGEVVVRFDTIQPSRMGPACDDFEQAVTDGELSHDGAEVIGRHLGNAVPENRRGHVVITKDEPDSPRKIDSAVAAVIAHHRAVWHLLNTTVEREPILW